MINFKNGSTILFQGDSITDGNRGRNQDDLNHVMGHGYACNIAGTLMGKYPEQNYTFYNRGISANKILGIYDRWVEDALALKPDIISLLAGVNDVGFGLRDGRKDIDKKYQTVLNMLIEETLDALPDVQLVLCEPFILPVKGIKDNFEAWSQEIHKIQQIVEETAENYKFPLIKLQNVFNEATKKAPAEYWIWDGVHPTVAGHYLISNEWLKNVSFEGE